MPISDLLLIFKWWLIPFFIGLSFFPLTSKIFSNFIDKGYIFSKVVGLLLISYFAFTLSSFHLLKFNLIELLICWGVIIIPQFLLLKKSFKKEKYNLKLIIFEEIIFFISLLFWTYIRGNAPDVHNLEKFMDFGFINSILRADYFPPKDIWLTPLSINYYYFGHLFTAVLIKLTNIPSFISFNLMISTIFAFCFSTSFSIGINLLSGFKKFSLIKNILLGLLFSFFISFAGNLQTIYSLFKSYSGQEFAPPFWKLAFLPTSFPNAYWYPNATRFIYRTIHEFPSYSFVVADLHGHVLDIPVVLTIIAVLLSIFMRKQISKKIIVFIGFLLSVAYMTNAWDGLIYLALTGLIILFVNIDSRKISFENLKNIFSKTLVPVLILILFFFLFSFLFNRDFIPFANGIGVICSPSFLTKIGSIGPLLFEKGQCQRSPFWQLLILYGFFFYMIFSFILFMRHKKINQSDYFVFIISFFSILLIIAPEIIYLKDIYSSYFRANTMFKLSYQAFMMFSLSSVYMLIRIFLSVKNDLKNKLSKISFIAFIPITLCLLLIVSSYSFFAIPSGYNNLKKYKNLDGIEYLKEIKNYDYQSILWINKNISGQPVILEAQGDSYTDYERISANTGLPTVLGWTVHEWLWRGSYSVPASRFDDIRNLYESNDLNLTKKLINKYKISYIYLGELEREKYHINEEKFSKLGKIIYRNNGAEIIKVN